jgi:hypothetical protein
MANEKLFMWQLLLTNKAPTWENLQKRNFVGLGRCPLYKQHSKDIPHLFVHYPFTKAIWTNIKLVHGISESWDGSKINESLNSWLSSPSTSSHKSLPLITTWGIWLAINHAIFD